MSGTRTYTLKIGHNYGSDAYGIQLPELAALGAILTSLATTAPTFPVVKDERRWGPNGTRSSGTTTIQVGAFRVVLAWEELIDGPQAPM